MVDKIHLENILSLIDKYYSNIEKLEELIIIEYKSQGGANITHPYKSYGWNLERTIDTQLKDYKNKVKHYPNKDSSSEYNWFIERFKKDIWEQLQRIEM